MGKAGFIDDKGALKEDVIVTKLSKANDESKVIAEINFVRSELICFI